MSHILSLTFVVKSYLKCTNLTIHCSTELYNTLVRGKKQKHFDGFNPQWGGGFRSESTFHIFFFTFNVKKICLNIGIEQ